MADEKTNKKTHDTLFGINDILEAEDHGLMMIKTDRLIDFNDHIFTPYSEAEMKELMENIEDVGLLVPILVRKHPSESKKYEILSGHNRVTACRRLGIGQVHARLFDDITDDEARLIVIETNLKQRNLDSFKISDRAKILTERHNLMKRQGMRTDLLKDIEDQDGHEKDTGNEPFKLGKTHIWRYMRINDYLSDGLKCYLDDGKINIKSGVELSFIDEEEQKVVKNAIDDGIKLTTGKATAIRKKSLEETITKEVLENVLSKKTKDKDGEKKKIKLSDDMIKKYFSVTEESEISLILELALEEYFKTKDGCH